MLGLAVIAALGFSAAPPAPVDAPTPIAAYGDRVVWSRPNAEGGFDLVQRVGSGPVRRLPVAPRRVPFDVDLGPTSGGGVLAVYSRCTTEPTGDRIPEYQSGRGCSIFSVDVTTGRETRYTGLHAAHANETWPTYWKGRMAFARAYDGGKGSSALYVKDLASTDRPQRVPGGTHRCGDPPQCTLLSRPLHLELYGSRLAFTWRTPGEGDTFEVQVDTFGSSDAVVVDESRSGITTLAAGWPSFENGRVYWIRQCGGDPAGCTPSRVVLGQSTYTGKIERRTTRAPSWALSHERAGGITWVLRDPSRTACANDPLTNADETCTLEASRPVFTAPR